MKIAHNYVSDGKTIKSHSANSKFNETQEILISLFEKIQPKRIIETGTYVGKGSTRIISMALETNNITNSVFYSIEVNPEYYRQAKKNVKKLWGNIILVNGLSIPRSYLPTKESIKQKTVKDRRHIFVDHERGRRVDLYYKETNFPDVEEDCLGKLIKEGNPDFVLLDSAGHVGNIEFQYLISLLEQPCHIALDDIYHIKHYDDFEMARKDNRFEIVCESKERFGFGVLYFKPTQNILWK